MLTELIFYHFETEISPLFFFPFLHLFYVRASFTLYFFLITFPLFLSFFPWYCSRELKAQEFIFKRQKSEFERAQAAEKQRQLEEEFEKQVQEYKEGKSRSQSGKISALSTQTY